MNFTPSQNEVCNRDWQSLSLTPENKDRKLLLQGPSTWRLSYSLFVGGLSFFRLLMDGVPPHIIDSYMREVQADKIEEKWESVHSVFSHCAGNWWQNYSILVLAMTEQTCGWGFSFFSPPFFVSCFVFPTCSYWKERIRMDCFGVEMKWTEDNTRFVMFSFIFCLILCSVF